MKTKEQSAKDLDGLNDQELILIKRSNDWFNILPVNRARINMELMNRGITKSYNQNENNSN